MLQCGGVFAARMQFVLCGLSTICLVRIHKTEWGEPEDCVAIAKSSEVDVIILHTDTDRCTIILYTPNAIEAKTEAKLMALNWLREPNRAQHGVYLIHNSQQTRPQGAFLAHTSSSSSFSRMFSWVLSCVCEVAFVVCISPPSPCMFNAVRPSCICIATRATNAPVRACLWLASHPLLRVCLLPKGCSV